MSYSKRVAPQFNVRQSNFLPKRGPVGSQFLTTTNHHSRSIWYRTTHNQRKPWGINCFGKGALPRMLLDRDVSAFKWTLKQNLPDSSRWEKVVNSQRTTEDRWSLVEEDGKMHKVNWKLYSARVESELKNAKEHLPQYTFYMAAVPYSWKKMDIALAIIKGLSVREAIAQTKLGMRKGHVAINKALVLAQQGAETKGLDKERLRVMFCTCFPGPVDKAVDIRSRGYYAWKSKKSCHMIITVVEDPEMVLPDRSVVPFKTTMALQRAGVHSEAVVLDVPAITADGI